MNWELFITAYQAASVEVKAQIDSGQIADCVQTHVANGVIDEAQQSLALRVASHLVLKTITTEQATQHLTEVGVQDVAQVVTALSTCAAAPATTPTAEKPTDFNKTSEQPQGIRTMADDINHIKGGDEDTPTYTSTQAAILREGENVASETTPAAAAPEQPPAPAGAGWEHTP